MFLAKVFIRLKPTVNDPQGLTIGSSLRQLGFDSVVNVRAGKFMEISLEENDESRARSLLVDMCEKLLANPIIEEYSFEVMRQ